MSKRQREVNDLEVEIFVYGTLKRGQGNHESFCRGALRIREATTRGRLYDLAAGYPALAVPGRSIRAVGTADYHADAAAQQRLNRDQVVEEAGEADGWDLIAGELMSFDDARERLPALDALEGFNPDRPSLYQRVLLPIWIPDDHRLTLAWAYAMDEPSGQYLPGGSWPAQGHPRPL